MHQGCKSFDYEGKIFDTIYNSIANNSYTLIRDIYYTYIALKKIVNNIFTTAKTILPIGEGCDFKNEYSLQHQDTIGDNVLEIILSIAEKVSKHPETYTQETACKELGQYIIQQRSSFQKKEEQKNEQILSKMDKVLGMMEEISYEPCFCCFKAFVSEDEYNFGIKQIDNDISYKSLPLTNDVHLDQKKFYHS